MTLSPAYGRDYRSKAEVQRDWESGKDFVVESIFFDGPTGTYTSRDDLEAQGWHGWVSIRYAKLRKVFVVKL